MGLFRRVTRSPQAVMVLWGIVVGVAAGYGALLFRVAARAATSTAWGTGGSTEILDAVSALPPWLRIAIPALGGLLVGVLFHLFVRRRREHGVPEVMESLAIQGGRLSMPSVGVKALGAAVSLGTGGSVGWEGPMVHVGAGVGSGAGQAMQASPRRLRVLTAAGAAGGIA
ncbi:MAG: chloride channel protein, partial [Planctomycetota bacterium]